MSTTTHDRPPAPTSAPRTPASLPGLTSLRWLAAFVVFGYHVRLTGWFDGTAGTVADRVFGAGHTGVAFFFVLSGVVLAWSAPSGDTPKAFWRRRFARIYPLHLTTGLLALTLGLTVLPVLHPRSVGEVVANLALVSAWNARWWQALDPASWSLVCEALFYLTFPALYTVLRRCSNAGVAAAAATAVAATIAMPALVPLSGLPISMNSNPLARWPEFVLGVAVGLLVRRGAWRGPGVLVGAGVAFAGYLLTRYAPGGWGIAAYTATPFAVLLAAVAQADLRALRGLRTHPLPVGRTALRLGELSFAFYLVHLLVLHLVERVVPPGEAADLGTAVAATGTAFVGSLGAAWLLNVLVERPAHRALTRRAEGARRTASAVVRRRRQPLTARHPRRRTVTRGPVAVLLPRRVVLVAAATGVTLTAVATVLTPQLLHRPAVAVPGPPAPAGATVVVGASISAGYQAGGDPWPAHLTDQLADAAPQVQLVNGSISATRLILSFPDLPSALDREETDTLSMPDVRRIVITDMVNDLQAPPQVTDPEVMLDAMRRYVAAAHARGVQVVGTTLTPYRGFERWTEAGERCREQVNAALRAGAVFDALIDFDRILADPDDPRRMRPDLDSGDHLHPGQAGHRVMADAAASVLARG